jgi:hypothetical protein
MAKSLVVSLSICCSWQYLAELTQRAEYRPISETVALDTTRKWIELKAKDQGDKSERISSAASIVLPRPTSSAMRKRRGDAVATRCVSTT